MKFLSVILTWLIFINAHAFESFSYSGRLVNSNGSPVTGNAKLTFDLTYSDQPGVILCSQVMDGVELVNGVFHVKLNFPTCNLPNIFKNTPANHAVSIRVTDNTAGGSKVYSYQAIHSVPYSFVSQTSKQLDSMNADAGEVLTWDGTKWTPVDPSSLVTSSAPEGAAGGALTGTYPNPSLAPIAQSNIVNLVSDLSSKIGLSQLSATLPLVYNNSTGVFSLDNSAVDKLDDLEVLPSGDGLLERSSGILVSRTCDSGEVLKWFSPAGWTCSEDSAEDSDKLPLIGGTLTGDLILETQLQIKNGISNSIVIKSPGSNTNYTLTLPPNAGGANQVLTTDGSGVLTWETPATSAIPSGPAGGVLNGTYPNPGLNDIPQSKVNNLVTDLASKIGLGDLSVTAPLIYNLGAFSISEATTSAAGTLSATDKTKLNGLEVLPGDYGLIERWSGGLRSLTCAPNEVLKWNGTIWACAADDDVDETKLPLTGGTLTGNLLLPGAPSDNQHATTKSYVDTLVSNNASKWTTATGGINYAGGNVGIGTATPAQKLHVANGNIELSSNFAIGTAVGSLTSERSITFNHSSLTSLAGLGPSLPFPNGMLLTSDEIIALGESDADSIFSYFDTNAKNFILDGRMGLGTTSPSTQLHIVGDARLRLTQPAAGANAEASFELNPGGDGAFFLEDVNNAATRMFISKTGNVGFATTNPVAPLQLNTHVYLNEGLGNIANGPDLRMSASGLISSDDSLLINIDGLNAGSGDFKIGKGAHTSAATNLLTIKNSGYVGIGTSAPGHTLAVNANLPSSYTIISNRNSAAGGEEWRWYSSSTGAPLGANSMCFGLGACILSIYSSGNATLSGTLTQSSDVRLKRDISSIPYALEAVTKLEGVSYYWKDTNKDQSKQIGLIAQDVEKVFPEAVKTNAQGYKSVAYQNLVAPLISALGEIRDWMFKTDERVQSLEKHNDELKRKNHELEQRLEKIEKMLNDKEYGNKKRPAIRRP